MKTISNAFDIDINESKIIESLMTYRVLSVSNLSVITKINRTSCYKYIDNLKKVRLIKEFVKGGKKVIQINNINDILFKFRDSIETEFNNKNSHLDHLEKIYYSIKPFNKTYKFEEPVVNIYEGQNALYDVYAKSLDSDYIFAFFNPWDTDQENEIDKWHANERITKKIPIKIILPELPKSLKFLSDKSKLIESKLIPSLDLNGMKMITDKYILNYSNQEKFGICLESKFLAENESNLYLDYWKKI